MTNLLAVRGLTASYGASQVLHGLDFHVEQGSITALLGANGAGKTTTLRALCGLIPWGGEVLLEGRPTRRLRTEAIVRLGIGMVPDDRGTFTNETVEENLRLGAISRNDDPSEDHRRMYETFPVLRRKRLDRAGLLSGGEQQMLAVARALMGRPRLLLLDEPSFGLAPMVVTEIFAMFRTLNQVDKLSILLVEQNAALGLSLSDHAYVIETGRIALSGPAKELQGDDRVRRIYLGK